MVSRLPRKQRLARYRAPLHSRHKFLGAPLGPELQKKHGSGALPVRKGDRVRVVRGDFRKLEGEVTEVDTKEGRIYVHDATTTKADGTKVQRPIAPSNVVILTLAEDKRRDRVFGRRAKLG